jgi:glycerophosphoryl diester phosphodiesterase
VTLIGERNPLVRVGRAIRTLLQPRPGPGPPPSHPAWVIAHRGAARIEPENTIPAFARAAELGADGVETDVCVTKDGHFILWHDADPGSDIALARQAGREELAFTPDVPAIGSPWRRDVAELTLEEFRRHYGYMRRRGGLADLVARNGPPEIQAATVEDLFAWAEGEPRIHHVVLDVKMKGPLAPRAIELLGKVRAWVSRPEARADLEFHYLNPHREALTPLLADARNNPLPARLELFADFELPGVRSIARRLGARHVSMGVGQRFWNEFRLEVMEVARAKAAGRLERLVVWTINEEDRLRELAAVDVDGILTDDAKTLRAIVSKPAVGLRLHEK